VTAAGLLVVLSAEVEMAASAGDNAAVIVRGQTVEVLVGRTMAVLAGLLAARQVLSLKFKQTRQLLWSDLETS